MRRKIGEKRVKVLHQNSITSNERSLCFLSGSSYLLKKNGLTPQGEDAHFIFDFRKTIGVADGVGSWARKGIDAGKYSRQLMHNPMAALENEFLGDVDPYRVLNTAFLNTKKKASSTACIITLKHSILHAVNVGGFMLFRNNKCIYQSPIQQHFFNCPYQLCAGKIKGGDLALADQVFVSVEPGDILVTGTDGLFDNIWPSEIENLIKEHLNQTDGFIWTDKLALILAESAEKNSQDPTYFSPYGKHCEETDRKHIGEMTAHDSKAPKRKEASGQLQISGEEMSQVTEVRVSLDFDASQAERSRQDTLPIEVKSASRPLDLNHEICIANSSVYDCNRKCDENSSKRSLHCKCDKEQNCSSVTSRGIGLDLNAEDVCSSMSHDPIHPHKNINDLKQRDVSECGSSTGPVDEKDSLRVWKEMKQNGFLSSSHGGISVQSSFLSTSYGGIPIPKQRGKKNKNDVMKKKMELAKKEQVDRFTKIAAPSGLLNGLNPGIINHVRNRKQVHSIIEALLRSENPYNCHSESRQASQASNLKRGNVDNDKRKEHEHMDDSRPHRLSCAEDGPPYAFLGTNQSKAFPMPILRSCSSISVDKCGESVSSMVGAVCGDESLMLKLSSSTKVSDNISSLSNEESSHLAGASSLSVKAATVASQWLELLQQDIKGRLTALRRSKKRVKAVISTELPFLISKEFSSNQENDPYFLRASADGISNNTTDDMHRARWTALFDQMDKALSEEEKQLESWLNQVKEMQLRCDQGLQHMHWSMIYGWQQLGPSENDTRLTRGDSSERELAVRAAAASIYSTCNFLSSRENVSCF